MVILILHWMFHIIYARLCKNKTCRGPIYTPELWSGLIFKFAEKPRAKLAELFSRGIKKPSENLERRGKAESRRENAMHARENIRLSANFSLARLLLVLSLKRY